MILSEQAMILALRQMILASRRAGRQGLPLDELVDLVQQPLPEATRCSVYRLLKLLKRNGVRRLPKQEEQAPEAGGTRNRPRRQTRPVQGLWAWDYGPGFVHMDCYGLLLTSNFIGIGGFPCLARDG